MVLLLSIQCLLLLPLFVGLFAWSVIEVFSGKSSKISNTFLILFSNKMLVFRAGIHKFLVRVANKEAEAVRSGTALFIYAFLVGI